MSLEEKFIKLSEEFVELQKAYAELRKENAFLKQRIVELEDKLGLNSSNSGLPTSKEIYKIERKQRLSSGKNPGGQPGHKFNGYKIVALHKFFMSLFLEYIVLFFNISQGLFLIF